MAYERPRVASACHVVWNPEENRGGRGHGGAGVDPRYNLHADISAIPRPLYQETPNISRNYIIPFHVVLKHPV